jgi:pyruvate kinase
MNMLLPTHKTKIVCTIGPASRSATTIRQLVKAGMNVARLNFSHGTLEEHGRDIQTIRSVSAELGVPVAILVDLPGPKIRIGELSKPVSLKRNDTVILTTVLGDPFSGRIPVTYQDLPGSVRQGSPIYISDGAILLKVMNVSGKEVRCKVSIGGTVLSHKGINLPGAGLSIEPVSEKDLGLVEFGIEHGITVFSISFVAKPEDVLKVKEYARKRGKEIHAVAKIERSEAIGCIDGILAVSDGIMVARGDLGVELPIQDVPFIQKTLIRKANARCCPVITATQMLLSMTENTRPTRAESTDVANAILDGTDAVMLSEETAMGAYPVQTVRMMAKIAESTERHRKEIVWPGERSWDRRGSARRETSDIVSGAVFEVARAARPRFVITPTLTGSTARRVSRFKMDQWILSFSPSSDIAEFLTLSYGVFPTVLTADNDDWHRTTLDFLTKKGLGRTGDRIVLTQGRFSRSHRTTDSVTVLTLE